MRAEQVIEFVKDYKENKGNVIDKYSDKNMPNQVASEWIPLLELLDDIRIIGGRK